MAPTPGRRVVSIAHDEVSNSGSVGRSLARRGFDVVEHVVCADPTEPSVAAPFPDHRAFDLVLVMGSAWSVHDPDTIPWVSDELAMIAAAHRDEIPVIGICFGGQALAAALGGTVERSPVSEIGWYELDGDRNPIGPGPWMQWHHDRFRAPPGADVLASTDVGPQLFTVGRSIGTQFHPEVDEAHVEAWLSQATDEYLTECGVERDRVLAEVRAHEQRNAAQCERFVDWALGFTERR